MKAIRDLINGNLTDAKKAASRQSHKALREAYEQATGQSARACTAAADFLKGSLSFQEYCNIEHQEKGN